MRSDSSAAAITLAPANFSSRLAFLLSLAPSLGGFQGS